MLTTRLLRHPSTVWLVCCKYYRQENRNAKNTYTNEHSMKSSQSHITTTIMSADLSPANVGWWCWKLLQNFNCNIFDEPLKTAALVPFLKCQLFTDVSNWIPTNSWFTSVKVFSIFWIEPHFNNSHVILQQINILWNSLILSSFESLNFCFSLLIFHGKGMI